MISIYSILCLLFFCVAVFSGCYMFLYRSLPRRYGRLLIDGISAPVTVYRDFNGVPHIIAANCHDLYFAQGYITAVDRLFQMDLSRRAAAGRLSEIFGSSQIDTDKFFRNLILRKSAEDSLDAYPQELLEIIQAYSSGVNAMIQKAIQEQRLPPEFMILAYEPEPWTSIDTLSIGKLMAYQLCHNWSEEIWRYQLIEKVGAEKASELIPDMLTDSSIINTLLGKIRLNLDDLLRSAYIPDQSLGSNAWVLAGSRTASGKPLLANDPHLPIRIPAIWYQTHLVLEAEKLNVIGVTFPGTPGIVIGHNEQIAWGITNMRADVQDLYVEIPNPQNPQQFLYDGRYEPAHIFESPIQVKNQLESVQHKVIVTRHGPIITPIANSKDGGPNVALALRWTAHAPTADLTAIIEINRSRNWQDFREALRWLESPPQNFTFAGVDGTIAYRGNGKIPIRKKGDGTLPVPGWSSEYEWNGFIPFDELPEVVNPPEGFIINANDNPVDQTYPYLLGTSWAPPYRKQRILSIIQKAKNSTMEEMQTLQNDFTNLQADVILFVLLPVLKQKLKNANPIEQEAITALEGWNRVDTHNSVGAAIWHVWYREFQRELFLPIIGQDLWERMDVIPNITEWFIHRAIETKTSFFSEESTNNLVVNTFRKAIAKLQQDMGKIVSSWHWGKLHTISFTHPLGAIKPLSLLFNVNPFPIGGSSETVNNQSYSRTSFNFSVSLMPSWRQVVSLTAPNKGLDVLTPGASGHPLSPHYRDQVKVWNQGKYQQQFLNFKSLQNLRKRKFELLPIKPGIVE